MELYNGDNVVVDGRIAPKKLYEIFGISKIH